ncbi:ribonuclease H-like domain-containing protein [Tanacetum coccineum]|uniref:Ribonuclease H-like domain-containing protein n=1 Tax=Tanacetum coccineum TaxID=301880 RepID=A0ABQ5DKY0_9ASTR
MSTKSPRHTLKQSTADPANIPKGYTQAASSKVQTAPNYASHSDEIICFPSFPNKSSNALLLMMMKTCYKLNNDAIEETDIRWQAYKAVTNPPTVTIIPPRANVSFTRDRMNLANRNKVVNQEKTKSSQPEIDRNKVIIEDWVDSDDEETDVSESQKETVFNTENSETSFEDSLAIVRKFSYLEELKFISLFSVSQICAKEAQCSLTDKDVLILLSKIKFVDEELLILRAPIKNFKFSWVFFLAYKDETYDMLHDLIVGLENRLRHKVKTIRCDNGTEFKNQLMNEFCAKKGIKREYSIARHLIKMELSERKNRTLIEALEPMFSRLSFYLFKFGLSNLTNIIFMRPLAAHSTILNTLDQLGKFDGKSEEGYLLGYSTSSKGFRVYNRRNPRKSLQAVSDKSWVMKHARRTTPIQATRCKVLCDLPEGKRVLMEQNGCLETKRMKEVQLTRTKHTVFAQGEVAIDKTLFIKGIEEISCWYIIIADDIETLDLTNHLWRRILKNLCKKSLD